MADASILASIARPFTYLLIPVIGVLSWQMAAAAVTGFIAKENVVGTLMISPASLNVGAAIVGGTAVAVMVAVVIALINKTNKQLKVEYALRK